MSKRSNLEKAAMISEAVTYLLLVVALFFLSTFYRTGLFVFFLIMVILLPAVSYLVCRYAFRELSLTADASTAYAQSGDQVMLSLHLHNPTFFPLPDCHIAYTLTSAFYPCDDLWLANCPSYARQDFSFSLPLEIKRCGCYQLRTQTLEAYDFLHFFHFRKNIPTLTEICVYPQEKETEPFEPTDYGEGFDEFEETNARGNTSSNVTDIREYIPGDRLQKIHWKLSAKIDKLMVKENEHTSSNQFTILVELFLPDSASDTLEESIKNGYGLARSLIAYGQPFFLCFYSDWAAEFSKTLIQNREQLDLAFSECFYFSPYREEDLGLSVYQRAGMQGGTLLHVSHKGVTDVVS